MAFAHQMICHKKLVSAKSQVIPSEISDPMCDWYGESKYLLNYFFYMNYFNWKENILSIQSTINKLQSIVFENIFPFGRALSQIIKVHSTFC